MNPSKKAHRLAPAMVQASGLLHRQLRDLSLDACPDPHDRYPFCLSVLETLLATYVAHSTPDDDDLDERIALTVRHIETAAREMYRSKG